MGWVARRYCAVSHNLLREGRQPASGSISELTAWHLLGVTPVLIRAASHYEICLMVPPVTLELLEAVRSSSVSEAESTSR